MTPRASAAPASAAPNLAAVGSGTKAIRAAEPSGRSVGPDRPPIITIAQALRAAAARLQPIADNPRLEARLLLAHALRVEQTELIRELHKPIDPTGFERLLARRVAREPVALILGRQEFWSMEFLVSPATLIPRADSESLVQAALRAFAHRQPPRRLLDLGTGTGCLLLALLHELPAAFGIGVDVAAAAATLAQCNAMRLGLADRSAFLCGDWTNSLKGTFDLVVANPPYIATPEITTLMPEVACYEPWRALDGGADGYAAYRTLLPRLRAVLATDGTAVLELGFGQADAVAALARELGFKPSIQLDLAGTARAIVLTTGIGGDVA